jgi:hypothetical protein
MKPFEMILVVLLTAALILIATRSKSESSVFVMPSLSQPLRGGDDRYREAPRPQRFWDNGPEIPVRGALDPIPTRGEPEAYQQMGVIVGVDNKPLPLYGRRVAPRSDRFNYYTRTDQYNPVALPVSYKRRDCQDNVGCDEMMNGDEVRLGATGETAKVTLYGFDGPKYVG